MRTRLRLLALVALGGCGFAAWLWGPAVIRDVEAFEVRSVEISGTSLLAPHEVLAASGIRQGQNLWDDRDVWERALRSHGTIASARVSRRLPATLRIRIQEKRPIAYVEAGALRLATAAGEILPVDPSRRPLDLPIVRADWSDSTGALAARRLLGLAGRLERLDPALLAEISEIRATRRGGPGAVLVHPMGELVLPDAADAGRIAQLRAVLAHLRAQGLGADHQDHESPLRVDLRYDDQIVVRFPSAV